MKKIVMLWTMLMLAASSMAADKYWYGGGAGHEGQYTWDTSYAEVLDPNVMDYLNAASSVATSDPNDPNDMGSGLVKIYIASNPYTAGQSVTIAGTTNYNGTYEVESAGTGYIVITETYTVEDFDGTETVSGPGAVDKGGGLVGLPSTAHQFSAGQAVTIAGTTNYNGTYTLVSGTSTNELVITDTYVAETFDGSETVLGPGAVDKGGGLVGLPVTGTGYIGGGIVTIAGTTNYNGTYTLGSGTSTNELVITDTYVAETFDGTETITNADSNWRLLSTNAATAKPATGDAVFFNGRAYFNATTNTYQAVDANMLGAETGNPDLTGVTISSEFNGDIGSSDEYWYFNADGDRVQVDGTGTYYFMLSAGVGSDAGCALLKINNVRTTVYIDSLENDAANVGLWSSVQGFAGTLYIDDGCAVTSLLSSGEYMTTVGGAGITNAKTSTHPTLQLSSGTLYWNSDIADATVYKGSLNWGKSGLPEITSAECTLLTQYGGTFNWQIATTDTSTLKQFLVYAGKLDAGTDINSGYDRTIGSGSEVSRIYSGATVDLNTGADNVSITAGSTIQGFGGTLIPPNGAQLSW